MPVFNYLFSAATPGQNAPAKRLSYRRSGLKLIFLLLIVPLLFPASVTAQKSRQQLEKDRIENRKRIEETGKILSSARTERKASLGALNALAEQVRSRDRLIKNIHKDLDLLQEEITETSARSQLLGQDLEKLKNEYAAMVYAARKADVYNRLMFVFSSGTFNQFVMRLKYLQQYSEARRRQAEAIIRVKSDLLERQTQLVRKTRQKEKLLIEQLTENEQLIYLKQIRLKMVVRLSKKVKELRSELNDRLSADRRLEKLIADMVRREIRRSAAAKAESTKGNNGSKTTDAEDADEDKISLTPETAILSSNFSEHKARLMWPVEAGFISGEFGKHTHPVLTHVIIDNLGVNIQTNESEKVRAVFDGVVGFVGTVGGIGGKIVSITHGDYFTVYCNVRNVTVKRGERIKAKSPIGQVYTDPDGISQIQFQIWKNTSRLNPSDWLIKK